VKRIFSETEQLSQNENVSKIKNEFCEKFPNQVSMGKEPSSKNFKRKF
jgi:hypothetical protein